MKLWKIKRPAGPGYFGVQPFAEDRFGLWLHAGRGSKWEGPHASGTLPFDALALLSPERFWVAWWVDEPADRRVEIDVCLAPQRETDGWSYVDLELDLVRHENGITEILDRDEFEIACREGWISSGEAEMAEAVATTLEAALRRREEPLGDEGWQRLANLRR